MSNWPFTFEAEWENAAEAEMEDEARRRRRPARRPVAPVWRRRVRIRPVLAPAAMLPIALPWMPPEPAAPPPPAPPEEPIEEPVEAPVEEPVDSADAPQEELYVTTGARAILNREEPVNAGLVYDEKKTLPRGPGLYVIRKGGRAIYVGIAENSIHTRFLQRYKSLRDFGMDSSVLDGVTVTTYELVSKSPGLVAIRKEKTNKTAPPSARKKGNAVSAKEGILRILEQAFIKHFGTGKKAGSRFGNTGSEGYSFAPGEKIILVINNRASTDPPSPIG